MFQPLDHQWDQGSKLFMHTLQPGYIWRVQGVPMFKNRIISEGHNENKSSNKTEKI